MSDQNRPPVETRDASAVAGVDVRQRIIEVIAVPYDQEAEVPYRGEIWKESFARGAFDGIEKMTRPVMANREHTRGAPGGKVMEWWPERVEGLVAGVRVAKTAMGDETLALAEDGMIRASVGFGARLRDMVLDRSTMRRRINKAFIDHLSFVEDPAYVGAEVLAVRENGLPGEPDQPLIPLIRPDLDELAAFLADIRSRYPRP